MYIIFNEISKENDILKCIYHLITNKNTKIHSKFSSGDYIQYGVGYYLFYKDPYFDSESENCSDPAPADLNFITLVHRVSDVVQSMYIRCM